MNKSLGIKRIIKFNICVILLMILLIIGLYEVKDQKFLIGKLSNYLADDEIVNFVITVKDDKNKDRVIPNSKFIIKELIIENGVEKEGMPYDVNGNLLGKEEVINGEIVRTFTTDENGTIIEAFKTGNYKIEQILANSEIGYELPEEAVAYFGVNSDRSAEIELKLEEPVIISDGEVTRAQVYQYRVAGRNDGTALYYYNGKVSYIDEKDNIIWTKETSDIGTIKQIETTESGFDVLTETRFVQFDLEGNILFNKVLISGLDGIGKFQSYTRTEDGKIAIVGDFIGTITATINNNTVTKTSGNSGKLRSVFVATFDENYEISNINSYYSSTYYYKADSITYTDDSYIITYERGDTETNNEINTVDNFIRKVDRSTLKTVKINGENALEVPDGETASPARLIDSIVKGEEKYLYYIGVLNGTAKISASDTVSGNAITLTSTGRDGLVIKYNKDLKVVWAIKIGGAGDDHLFGVEVTEDTGIILGGDSSKGGITFSKEETEFGVPITSKPTGTAVKDGEWRGIVVKINSDGKAVWANGFGFSSDEGCYNLAAFTNNSFVLCGFSAVTSGGSSVEKVSFMRGNEIISSEEIEQKTSLDIFNSKKEYKITTEISNVEGLDKPGTISEALEGEEAYEIVAHGENSTKQIEINANDGYVIKSIKLQKEDSEGNITEENIEIPANSKNYVINTLENVRENINVVAEFKKATSKIIVHHYFKDTETPVLNQIGEPIADEEIEGNIDEEYSLKPSDKIASYYEVVEIPDSARGIFEDETKEIIFYYKYKEFAYTIEYYYAGVKDSDKTEAGLKATYQEVVKDYTDKIVTGYKFDKVEAVTISEDESQNVLKVYYVIDETQKKTLTYTVEYYKDGIKVEEDTQTESKTVQVLQPDTLNVDKTSINTTDKYVGYKLDKEKTNIPDEIENGGVVNVYYVKDDFNYTVEYYYDGEIDNSKTETVEATYQDVIENYIDKNITGYKLEKTDNLPLTVSEVSENNVIKIYYITDDENTKELSYTVEYYKDGTKVEGDIEEVKTTVQILQPDTLVVDKDSINIADKYVGYKLDSERTNIPETIENGGVIKIYYVKRTDLSYTVNYIEKTTNKTIVPSKKVNNVTFGSIINSSDEVIIIKGYILNSISTEKLTIDINENVINVYYEIDYTKTKELSYTVRYYKEEVLQEEDTKVVKENVQVLSPDTLSVDRSLITNNSKYFGYKLSETKPTVVPDEIENGSVIEVYYVVDNNQTKELSYTVEYYKDGTKVEEDTQTEKKTVQVLEPDKLIVDFSKINTTDKYIGYKLSKISPVNIPNSVENGTTIKIYYVKDSFEYTIEYYYEGIIDESKTYTEKALYETIIKDYEDKNIEGYRFEKTEGAPLKVSENERENIIKVYYIIDDKNTKTLNYTVEYYKDGVLQEGDTQIESETVQVLQSDTLNVDTSKINKTNKYTGYKLQKTEPNEIPSVVNNGDVIKIYYVKDNFDYTVEYYYDDVKDESKTEILNDTFENIIKTYPDKSERKYDAYKTENLPLKITEDSSKNIIKIYYTKKESTITVHYYVEGTEESISKDLVIKDKVDTVHKIAPAKDVPEKYELVKSPENEELTMTVESIEVTYFYRVKDSKVIVRYIDKEKNNVLDEEIINGKIGDTYKTEAKTIESYNLITEELPLNKEGIMKVNEITVNYYYKKAPSNIPEPSGTTNNNIQKEETNLKEEKDSNVVNTGDNLPTILISIIVLVIVMNLVQMKVSTASQISSKARTFRKIRKIRKNSNERVARISRIDSTKRCKRKKSKTRGRRAK